MRFCKLLGSAAMAVALAACANNVETLRSTQPKGTPFTIALANEYLAYAEFEKQQYDWPDAGYFADKGLAAAAGTVVPPEDPADWSIKSSEQEVVDARRRLLAALEGNGRTTKPAVAARAQAKYDCWLEQLEEGWQLDHIAGCRRDFLAALAELEARPAQPTVQANQFMVFFDWDRSDIRPDARRILEEVVRAMRERRIDSVAVVGHADRSGPDDYNVGLSQRRADAVQRALTEMGVPADRISLAWRGESEPLVPTNDGVREPQNRRAVLNIR